ncbi:MAG: hypothetical protein ABGY42_16360 [bacterium]
MWSKDISNPFFTKKQDSLRWSRFKEMAPETMFETVPNEVFPFNETLGEGRGVEEASICTQHMKDALFMMPTPGVLASVVDQFESEIIRHGASNCVRTAPGWGDGRFRTRSPQRPSKF